eukprot:GEMP01009424.1.p1 GENE.GEMP01009424.1~~GEMP01009424.1.p1  ORF type:complete len:483 (+),score=105.51 GEMP01009424.1:291-1739(+)
MSSKRPRSDGSTMSPHLGAKKSPKFHGTGRHEALDATSTDNDHFLQKYSLDDLRRLTQKQIALGMLDPRHIDGFLENEKIDENRDKVICMLDSKIKWTSYPIRNQEFLFPHFMKNPVYLASGGFGVVVKCFRYGQPVAVKKVAIPDEEDWEMALRLLRELVILKQAKKMEVRHVCKIIDIFGDHRAKTPMELDSIYIVMPLYVPGALDSFNITDAATFKIIAGHSLSALHFLHVHRIMHRDIKKENIFYDAAKKRAYLADLGQARTWNAVMSGNGEVGTRCYLSPEILQGQPYDYRSDVYSLGIAWYEALCCPGNKSLYPFGRSGGTAHIAMQRAMDPIQTKSRRNRNIKEPYGAWANDRWKALQDKKIEFEEESLITIVEQCLMFDPRKRADTAKLFEIPYFFEFVTKLDPLDLREVDTASYTEIKRRIFDLQHGSCSHASQPNRSPSPEPVTAADRKARFMKMCSMAVEYFEDSGSESSG